MHDVARRAVHESLVLLKNQGRLLPLAPKSKVLVVGKSADSLQNQTGGWSLSWQGTGNTNADFPNGTTILAGLRQAESDPGDMASRLWAETLFGSHPYGRPSDGTLDSRGAVTADDLKAFHHRTIARDNLHVVIVGAGPAGLAAAIRIGQLMEEDPATAERLGEVPVYNVSVPVMGEDWWVFELAGRARAMESYWEDAVQSLRDRPNVIDLRNFGLIAGIELAPRKDLPTDRAVGVFQRCFEHNTRTRCDEHR